MENICFNEECKKPSTLQCPNCLKLGLPPAYFCSQDCFKKCWSSHKTVHQVANLLTTPSTSSRLPPHFEGFAFTGPLRPGIVSPRLEIPAHIPRPDYAETGDPISERISKSSTSIEIKTPEQIEKMRKVCRLAREILDTGAKAAKVGVTTDEIDKIIHQATIERGAYPSTVNYKGFPKSCCTSVNEVICHGIPDSRPLQDGDILNIDVSCYYDGVHGDINETYLIGNVNPQTKKLVQAAYECLEKAIAIVKPGTLYRDVGNVISRHINQAGFSVVRSYCGHGVGELFHAPPSIPHYAKSKAVGVMKPGHVFTIEPMINMGSWHDTLWPDDWTAVTQDGKPSAQFEHTILVTETGCEVLTARIQDASK